jgi:hypothetical protein
MLPKSVAYFVKILCCICKNMKKVISKNIKQIVYQDVVMFEGFRVEIFVVNFKLFGFGVD